MKASDRLTDTPRSSLRSQHQGAGQYTTAVPSSLPKTSRKDTLSAKAVVPQIDKNSENGTPTRSSKRAKTEATVGTAEPSTPSVKTRPSKAKQQYLIEQEGEESEVRTEVVEKTSRKRKVEGDREAEVIQVNGMTLQSPKRNKTTQFGEVNVEVDETSTKKTKRRKGEAKEEEVEDEEAPSAKRNRKTKVKEKEAADGKDPPVKAKRKTKVKSEEVVDGEASPAKVKRKTKVKKEEEELDENGEPIKKVVRKRKTKEEKEAEAMPLAARTNGLRMFIGAHVSCAKGVHNTVTNCVHIGGNAFAMFLKSQRKWENPPLQDEHKDLFISNCGDHKYDSSSHVLPHGSYLVNLAQEDPGKATQAYDAFLDDLHRCEALGIKLYNFHPGSTGSHPRPSAIARIAKALNRAHLATKTVTPVLETMAAGGNVIGSTFEDLRDLIALIDDKQRIGVCLDTCHVFAAGYDLRSPSAFKKTLDDFDRIVGMKYLRALHLNDSKAPFDSHRDLHQNIGLGFLGLRAFHNVMNEPRFEGLPMVLETPIDHKDPETGKDVEDKSVWAREIKMLEGLIGADADSEDFKAVEKDLADKGAEERKKLQEQYDKKMEKDRKALEKGQMKLSFGKKTKKGGSEQGSDSEA